MLSIILYGRNDSHGYNYHKRFALGINCIAETLSDPQDEILFVDYNTPNDLPTIIESLEDTLTLKAKSHLRVFRMRPHYHRRFGRDIKLSLLESISRNLAIRRSNPSNKWILSTNIDMIFVMVQEGKSLTSIVSTLSDGVYGLPRLELPETFWETCLERSNPQSNIAYLRAQGKKIHLNTAVCIDGFLRHDNPGDFQLILREDLFRIGGFDERMVMGFHVDANLCKRMSLLRGDAISLSDQIKAYHCNHNSKESLPQSNLHTENDWNFFVRDITSPFLEDKGWGLRGEEIEEVDLKKPRSKIHSEALVSALRNSPERERILWPHASPWESITYSSADILTYLVDHIYTIPKTANIAYIGYNSELLTILETYLEKVDFQGKIFCLQYFAEKRASDFLVLKAFDELIAGSFLFIFDFGFDERSQEGKKIRESEKEYIQGRKRIKRVMKAFLRIIYSKDQLNRDAKFIGINALHADMCSIFQKHLSTRKGSFASGVSFGYFPIPKKKKRWFPIQQFQKKTMVFNLQYLVIRHFFSHADRIRNFVSRTRMAKKI